MNNFVLSLGWFVLLVFVGMVTFFLSFGTKTKQVPVGPFETYNWIADTSTIIGDGETHLHMKSEEGNFTVYDENGIFVASGEPVEMVPGDTKQKFIADFETGSGKMYLLKDHSVTMYTLVPRNVTFESRQYGYLVITVLCIVLFLMSLLAL